MHRVMQGWITQQKVRERWRRHASGVVAVILVAGVLVAAPAMARPAGIAIGDDASDDSNDGDALPYRQCVPFARQSSGIQLYGDALTWWDQAAGRYARGREPRIGAIMSFRPYHAMTLGHVAMVSKVIDSHTVLLRHANWSPIDGRRGQIEMDVRAVDVSPDNDWSEVRVWYAPIGDLGTTHWPVNGFIYNRKPRKGEDPFLAPAGPAFRPPMVLASAGSPRPTRLSAGSGPASLIGADFLTGIRPEAGTVAPNSAQSRPRAMLTTRFADSRPAPGPATLNPALRDDPISRIIAQRMR